MTPQLITHIIAVVVIMMIGPSVEYSSNGGGSIKSIGNIEASILLFNLSIIAFLVCCNLDCDWRSD